MKWVPPSWWVPLMISLLNCFSPDECAQRFFYIFLFLFFCIWNENSNAAVLETKDNSPLESYFFSIYILFLDKNLHGTGLLKPMEQKRGDFRKSSSLFFSPFTVALLRWSFPGLPLCIGTVGATLGRTVLSKFQAANFICYQRIM